MIYCLFGLERESERKGEEGKAETQMLTKWALPKLAHSLQNGQAVFSRHLLFSQALNAVFCLRERKETLVNRKTHPESSERIFLSVLPSPVCPVIFLRRVTLAKSPTPIYEQDESFVITRVSQGLVSQYKATMCRLCYSNMVVLSAARAVS